MKNTVQKIALGAALCCTSLFASASYSDKISGVYDQNPDGSPLVTNCHFISPGFVGPDVLDDSWYILEKNNGKVRAIENAGGLIVHYKGNTFTDALGVKRVGLKTCGASVRGDPENMINAVVNWRVINSTNDGPIMDGDERWQGIFLGERFTETCIDLMKRSSNNIPYEFLKVLKKPCSDTVDK